MRTSFSFWTALVDHTKSINQVVVPNIRPAVVIFMARPRERADKNGGGNV